MTSPPRRFDPVSLLLSLGLAVLLWAYVDDRRIEAKAFDVPLRLVVPEGWELDRTPPDGFEVRLQGPRELMKSLRPGELEVVHRIAQPDVSLDSVQFEFTIEEADIRTPPGVVVVEQSAKRFTVGLIRLMPQYIRVEPKIEGEPAPGYRMLRTEPSPPFVKVMAPKGAINFGDTLECYPIDISGKAKDVGRAVGVKPAVIDGRMVRSNTDVWVSVIIEPIPTTRRLEKVPVRVLQGPQMKLKVVRVSPPTATLIIEGPQSEVDKLSERDPLVYVDIVEAIDITGEPQGEHTLTCRTQLPSGVELKGVDPPQVTVEVR